jgi:polyphosphate kinase
MTPPKSAATASDLDPAEAAEAEEVVRQAEATVEVPEASDSEEEIAGPPLPADRFINRELSWLVFNGRVLEEARNPHHPLLERLRFLSISASNLDEFQIVRVAGLKAQRRAGIHELSPDNRTPEQQLALIEGAMARLNDGQQQCWRDIKVELAAQSIAILHPAELGPADREWLEKKFVTDIYPVLTPLAVDPAHPFPFLANRQAAIALSLQDPHREEPLATLIPLPAQLERFIRLPGEGARFALLEEVVLMFFDHIFAAPWALLGHGLFRVLRDSEMEIEEGAEDLMLTFESALKRRRHGGIISLAIESAMPEDLRGLLLRELEVGPEELFVQEGLIALVDIKQLILDERQDLLFKPFNPRFPERIRDFGGDCFAAVRNKDIVVHHPYESFDVVVQFLKQAARDPAVVSIKQTLYRTSRNSPIVAALIAAAEAGKSVTAMVELKARFDEEANIQWARDLERAGVHVVFGFITLKTHAKISLVVRREADGLRSYVHFGTGNYHPITARIYTDLSFFTCDPVLCADAVAAFNYMTRLCRAARAAEAGTGAAEPAQAPRRADRCRDRPCPGRPAGRHLGEDELPCRSGHHRQALRSLEFGCGDRSRHPRDLLPQARRRWAVGAYKSQEHRRALPGAQPDPLLRRRQRPALAQGQGLHLLRRLDAPQSQPPDRDPGADRESDGA